MKKILTVIFIGMTAIGLHAQTIKSLGYNTTDGFVVYSGTNVLTFTNPLQFATNARAATRTNLGGTTVGNDVFTATNAAAGAVALALGTTNNVQFRRLKMIAAGAGDNVDDATLWLDTSGTNKFASIRMSGTGGGAEKYNAYLTAGAAGLNVSASSGFRVLNGGTANIGSVLFSVGSSGNATMNGTASVAPNQTASSGASLMTRELSDARFYPLASFWLPAEDMQSYNAAGAGDVTWTSTAAIANMVTPFGRAPRTVAAIDGVGRTRGIYTIPSGWPAGAQVRVTTYLALFSGDATTNTFVFQVGGFWTTNTNIISPVETVITATFTDSSLLTTNVTGTGATNEYFKISNTFSFATNANVENRQVFIGRLSNSTNDTATNTIYFIGSHVELLP